MSESFGVTKQPTGTRFGDRSTRRVKISGTPSSLDTDLVVEILDASLPTDVAVKSLIYSRDNIAKYWVVNIPDRQVEMFTQPSENGYQTRQVLGLGTQTPIILENKLVGLIDVTELFA